MTADPRYIEGSPNTRSELAVPLVFRNEVLGVLNVESEQTDAYTGDDEEMLSTLGASLAAIIANARLLARVRAQAERERAIYEISGRIRREMPRRAACRNSKSLPWGKKYGIKIRRECRSKKKKATVEAMSPTMAALVARKTAV